MTFKNLDALLNHIENDVIDTLKNEVAEEVKDTM